MHTNGDLSVSKYSLVMRFINRDYIENRQLTMGAIFLGNKEGTLKFKIWDTASQEHFHTLALMNCENAIAAIVVYDVINA
ncbi:unnamed protein product, partial [Rhizopus stolonifer]